MSIDLKKDSVLLFLEQAREMPEQIPAQQRVQNFDEIYQDYSLGQASQQAARCLDCGIPYCQWKCPLHNYIPNWLNRLAVKDIDMAIDLVHQTNPLPEVCGRVCPQDKLCEGACTLNSGFGAITIGAIEKHLADLAMRRNWLPDLSQVEPLPYRVAIIGAGPAGLGCADFLLREGIHADVYDSYPEIGGLLTYGIPDFKLEKHVMRKRKDYFEQLGVRFILEKTIGKDISFADIETQYDAIFLGLGAYKALDGHLETKQFHDSLLALDYLIANNIAIQTGHGDVEIAAKDRDVIVLGGGDTAMDCVRTAIRQHARSVRCLYRRDEASMPASKRELAHARAEGVEFIWHQQPEQVTQAGKHLQLQCRQTNADNAPRQSFQTDYLIIAFGFQAELQDWFANYGLSSADGKIATKLNPTYLSQTANPKVFAGGDMVRGADLVVTALADGRQAAHDIVSYLKSQA